MRFAPPSRALRLLLLSVDLGFIVYWVVTGLHLLPDAWLYAHHDDPAMVAWNGSFMPLDLAASAFGISALFLARRREARWALVALLSLAATSASGLNAIAFWALRGEFDMGWWAPNVVLLLAPWPFVREVWRAQGPS